MASTITPGAGARWIPASRKRHVLAIYVDLVLLGVPWALASALLRRLLPDVGVPGPAAAVFAFAVAEVVLINFARYTPGYALLGMRFATPSTSGQPAALVDREIKQRESWLTLLMAVLLLNSGAKGLVRWTQWHTPLPLFGVEVGAGASIAASMVIGALSCLVAFSLFRLTARAWPLGIAYMAVSLLFTLASWDRWDAWVADEVHNRRAYQGVPVREGEVEFMQSLFPEALLAALALYGVGLAAAKRRLDG